MAHSARVISGVFDESAASVCGMSFKQDEVIKLSDDLANHMRKQYVLNPDKCIVTFSENSIWAPKLVDLKNHYDLVWLLLRWSGPRIPGLYILSSALRLANDKTEGLILRQCPASGGTFNMTMSLFL